MINIYDSTETRFSHNGICSLDEKRELIKCTIHRKLEGAYEGTLFISKENLKWTEFIEGRILKLPVDINGRTQLFRIFDTSDDFTDLEVYFKHIFFDLDDFFIEDTNIVEKDGRGAINQILNTTVDSHRFTATSDINIINNCRIVDKTVTEAIGVDENCFLNRWGGEIDYDNFKFKINEKIGSDNGYRISLRKNLKAINGDISIIEVATKLKIKGYDGIKLDEYLISPLANAYPHFKTRVVKFDDIKVKSDPDNPEEEGYETLQAAQLEMRRRGLELFSKQNIDKPTVNFEIDIDEMREENIEVGVLEVLSIGDIATLELEDFLRSNIEVKQRVIELEFDCIRKINIKVILGESTSTIFKEVSKIESILNDLNDKLEGNSWQDILDKSMEQATDIIAEGFKDSHVIPRKNEIIVADNIDLNLAKKVIVINKNGIGFSLEGYRPDRLTLAMTIDGEINASCIKFGSMSGALIDVGTIEADRLSVQAMKEIKDSISGDFITQSEFEVASNEIYARVSKETDPNNLIPNGAFEDGINGYEGWKSEISAYAGVLTINANDTATDYGFLTPRFNLAANSTYSLSFDVNSYYNTLKLNYCYLMDTHFGNIRLDSNITLDPQGATTRVKLTFKTIDKYYNVRLLIGYEGAIDSNTGFRVAGLILAKGEVVRDYTPKLASFTETEMKFKPNSIIQNINRGLEEGSKISIAGTILDLNGFSQLNYGKLSVRLNNNGTHIYSYLQEGKVNGSIQALRTTITNDDVMAMTHERGAFLSIDYSDINTLDNYLPYIRFDKYGILTPVAITFFQDVDFGGNALWLNKSGADVGSQIFGGKRSDGTGYTSIQGTNIQLVNPATGGFHANISRDDFDIYSNRTYVRGNLAVVGNKNCLQKTKFGDVPFYANEDVNSLLTETDVDTIYETKLVGDKYICRIEIDSIIQECINTTRPYNVYIDKMTWGDYKVEIREQDHFIVESDRPFRFKYKLEGRRSGFESESKINNFIRKMTVHLPYNKIPEKVQEKKEQFFLYKPR